MTSRTIAIATRLPIETSVTPPVATVGRRRALRTCQNLQGPPKTWLGYGVALTFWRFLPFCGMRLAR